MSGSSSKNQRKAPPAFSLAQILLVAEHFAELQLQHRVEHDAVNPALNIEERFANRPTQIRSNAFAQVFRVFHLTGVVGQALQDASHVRDGHSLFQQQRQDAM